MNENNVERKCFCCKKILTGSMDGEELQGFSEPPSGAVCFSSPGNFGSRVFDPGPHGGKLEISICDDCLVERKDLVIFYRVHTETSFDVKAWNYESR